MARYFVTYLGRHLPLPEQGRFVIGRDSGCDLRLDDPLCSRKHAAIFVTETGVTFEDLGSRNGSKINGAPVQGPQALVPGVTVEIGAAEILFSEAAEGRERADTRVDLRTQLADDGESTRQTTMFHLLAGVAQKALTANRVDEAERILGKLLMELMPRVRKGEVSESELEDAARYALRLAEASGHHAWIDWVFDAYRESSRVMQHALIDALHALVRDVKYRATPAMRAYVESVDERRPSLSPPDRFLASRLTGLLNACGGHSPPS